MESEGLQDLEFKRLDGEEGTEALLVNIKEQEREYRIMQGLKQEYNQYRPTMYGKTIPPSTETLNPCTQNPKSPKVWVLFGASSFRLGGGARRSKTCVSEAQKIRLRGSGV